jgi:hypothetical protein
MYNLAILLKDQGKMREEGALLREALEGMRATLGPRHKDTRASINNLASLVAMRGKAAEGERLFREAIEASATRTRSS